MTIEEIKEPKLPRWTEFESKYRTDLESLPIFLKIAHNTGNLINYLYVSGPDTFYVKDEGSFGRYRKSDMADKDGSYFAQWTIKEKQKDSKNNFNRFESNWTVTGTPIEEIHAGAEKMGYKRVGKVHKDCHIFRFPDSTIVFYTVTSEGSDKKAHYIEVEVDEETIHQLTETEAWAVIEKYENILKDTGINAKKRLKLSLFEIYRNDVK
jgi:adenylate cyclase class IV